MIFNMQLLNVKALILFTAILVSCATARKKGEILRDNDRERDVELITTHGNIVLRLHDSTPLHRDNFLRLVKAGFYDSILFHRVIKNFMIQAGDPESKRVAAGQPLGSAEVYYTIPAEFKPFLYHKRGALAAARLGDDVNPEKRSSGSQFYIVQGKTFTDAALDSVEINRLKGRKLPDQHRQVYKTVGGTPQLDQNYTVFGEVVRGMDVVDRIATVQTSRTPPDRPVENVRITKAHLIKRR